MKTAENTATKVVAPSEHDTLVALVAQVTRCDDALEKLANPLLVSLDDAPPVADTKPPRDPRTPLQHVRDDEFFHGDKGQGLFLCKVCGLAEGTLTTECPGEKPLKGFAERVYKAEIDFAGGEWRPYAMAAKLARTADRFPRNSNELAMPRPRLPEAAATGAVEKSAGAGVETVRSPAPEPAPAAVPEFKVLPPVEAESPTPPASSQSSNPSSFGGRSQ